MNLSNLFCFQGVRHWNTEYKETKEKSRRWRGNNNREFLTVRPLPPSVPLAHLTVVSVWATTEICKQLFFILFHWSSLTPSGERIKYHVPYWIHTPPHPPPLHPLPPLLWVFSKEMMKPWKYEKCSSQGSVKEAISIKPMSISCVEENNTSLWCCCTRCSSDSTYAGADRAHITDWWILNYCGGWHLC